MKRTILLSLFFAAKLCSAQIVFYGGDYGLGPALEVGIETGIANARIYDNVRFGGSMAVDFVFGNYLVDGPTPTQIYFEFRQDVSEGNGGTVIASGTLPIALAAPTGNIGFGLPEWHFSAEIPRVILSANTMYWLSVSPSQSQSGHYYLSTTEGQNGIGGPLGDGNSFYDSTSLGANFDPTTEFLGAGTWDFSQGFGNHVIPEPASFATLGLGIGLLFCRGRKRMR